MTDQRRPKPPAVIFDGRTGRQIQVHRSAEWTTYEHYICLLVELLGYEKAAAYLGIPMETR